MFSMKNFIKKGVLDEANLAEINARIETQYPAEDPAEEITEEV